jgi:hypothetical protein
VTSVVAGILFFWVIPISSGQLKKFGIKDPSERTVGSGHLKTFKEPSSFIMNEPTKARQL